MPHIKVAHFSTEVFDDIAALDGMITFRAIAKDQKHNQPAEELIGINFEGEDFVLELHRRDDAYLIKPEKSTRLLDANRIKRALAHLSKLAHLDIVHENITLSPHKPPLAEEYNKRVEDFETPDFGGRKIAIEVGFGSGRHLLYRAKTNPDILHIGIEIHTPSAEQVLKQIELQKLSNVWVINYDARLLLEMLPSNRATMIYVHFPVPWDKKPHRRVISKLFVTEAMRVLEVGGALELRTDSDKYFVYALEVFSSLDKANFEVKKNNEAVIRSKYEDRWQRQEKDIYTISLYSSEESSALENEYDFSFSGNAKQADSLFQLPPKAILKQDHFVHFEKRYKMTSEEGALIKCSFGSFDRPEHKLIMVREKRAAYYPQMPVGSATNNNAHQTIGEYICLM